MRRKALRIRRGQVGSPVRAAFRAAVLAIGTALMAPVQCLLRLFRLPAARRFPMWWHRLCCRATGIRLRIVGTPETCGPVLYVANHISYLDIPVLGSLLEASFIAKSEVARWPGSGFLCRLQRTMFVDRQPGSVMAQLHELRDRLAAGDSMILFPEGTSGDGNRVLPFKSVLFRAVAAEGDSRPVRVQPVTIAYSRFDGAPMGRNLRPRFAWYGDMAFRGHFWTCLGMGRPGVDLVFHPAVTPGDFPSHTELARHCEERIAGALSNALSGRLMDDVPTDDLGWEEEPIDPVPVYSL